MYTIYIKNYFDRSLILLVILLFLPIGEVLAQTGTKQIDRCSGDSCTHYIVFSATDGDVPGHAFVGWGQENWQTRMSEFQAWGLYPKDQNTKVAFGTVPGEVRDDWLTSTASKSYTLIVRVDRNDWEGTLTYKDLLKEGEFGLGSEYNLYLRNCVHFTAEVAKGIGLNTPEGIQHPKQFISNLKSMND